MQGAPSVPSTPCWAGIHSLLPVSRPRSLEELSTYRCALQGGCQRGLEGTLGFSGDCSCLTLAPREQLNQDSNLQGPNGAAPGGTGAGSSLVWVCAIQFWGQKNHSPGESRVLALTSLAGKDGLSGEPFPVGSDGCTQAAPFSDDLNAILASDYPRKGTCRISVACGFLVDSRRFFLDGIFCLFLA